MSLFYNSTAYCPVVGLPSGGSPGGGMAGLGATAGNWVNNISYVQFVNGQLRVYGTRMAVAGWYYIYNAAVSGVYTLGQHSSVSMYDGMKGWQQVGFNITPTGVVIGDYYTMDCCGGAVFYRGTTCHWYN